MSRGFLTLFLMGWAIALLGCSGPELHDSIDLKFDFKFTPSDELHLPYVVGAQVRISARGRHDSERWTLESADPSILRIDSQSLGSAECTAVSEGVTTMRVRDEGGRVIHEAEIEVARPDRATIHPHGLMIVGVDAPLRDPHFNILTGGTATFKIQYYRGRERLYGHGALTVESTNAMMATPRRTMLFEDREWLQLTPQEPGEHNVELFAGGSSIGTIAVSAVGEEALSRLELIHELGVRFERLDEGDSLTVLALARDEEDFPVYGVEPTWDINGWVFQGDGDLFRYEFMPDTFATLGSELNGLRSEIEIRGRSGYVDSSNRLGCSAGGHAPRPPNMTLLLALGLALAALRAKKGGWTS